MQNLRERIDGEFRNGKELLGWDETAAVSIQLAKPLVQRHCLLLRNYTDMLIN
jgi:hypothetical protein